jgi:hypothetical protein
LDIHIARTAKLTINSVVISMFAIVILSTLGLLFKANHPELVGGDEDPKDGATVAATVFIAVIIYAVRSLFFSNATQGLYPRDCVLMAFYH